MFFLLFDLDRLDEDEFAHIRPLGDPYVNTNMSTAEANASAETPPLHNSKLGYSSGSCKQGKRARRGANDDEVMLSTCRALESAAKEIAGCFKGIDYAALDDEVEAIPGLTEDQVTQALELFCNNEHWSKLFLGMKKARRGNWLKGKLGLQTGPN